MFLGILLLLVKQTFQQGNLDLVRRWKTTLDDYEFMGYSSASFSISDEVVYVLNGANVGNDILKFDLEGNYLGQYAGWYNFPVDLVIGGQEQVLISAIGARGDDNMMRFGMVVYNSSGDFFHGFHESETGLVRPYGLSSIPGSDNLVAVCDWDSNRTVIMEVDWMEGSITSIVDLMETPYPFRIMVTEGKVIVLSSVCCQPWHEKMIKLSVFDLIGNLLVEVKELPTGEIISSPEGIAVDPEGNILLSDVALSKTILFSPEAEYIGEIAELGGEQSLPHKMLFHQGMLYTLSQEKEGEEMESYINVYNYNLE